jgi:hypothetical protein
MRRAIFTAVSMLLLAFGAAAQTASEVHDHSMMDVSAFSQEEHLAHLRELVASKSLHGPVIPQPAGVSTAAVKNFTITATSFAFSVNPSPFVVNQGDVVNITLTVPANDSALVGHGILMEAYILNGLDCQRGKTAQFSFTATTAGDAFAFVCTQPDCGSGHSLMFGTMKVLAVQTPAPTVSSILPTSGSTAGGTVVTISGSGFSNPTVKFGGIAATNVSSSASSITATTPAHAAGAVDVVVTNSDNQSATVTQGFTYVLPNPTISNVSPNTGPTTGGTLVTITGTNFQTGATVKFGALSANDVNVVNATTLTAHTPLGPATQQLAVDVAVTNPDTLKATATGAFTYTVPPLAVVSVTPNIALPNGAAGAAPVVVTIFGAGFTTALTSSVSIGGVPATNVQVVDAVTIRGTIPALAAGASNVVVTVGGSSATLNNAILWQNAPAKHRAVKH